jgi:hypothetical protein
MVAPGIEPGPLDLWAGTLTTRPQRRSREQTTAVIILKWILREKGIVYSV